MCSFQFQKARTACLNQLVPCLQCINSTRTPSSSCCTLLRSLIDSDPGCLCSLLGSITLTKQAGVNVNQAIQLPKRCGEKATASLCKRKFTSQAAAHASDSPFMPKEQKKKNWESKFSIVDSSTQCHVPALVFHNPVSWTRYQIHKNSF